MEMKRGWGWEKEQGIVEGCREAVFVYAYERKRGIVQCL